MQLVQLAGVSTVARSLLFSGRSEIRRRLISHSSTGARQNAAGGLGAAGAQVLAAQYSGQIVPTIGASGGVLGLLPAFAILFPRARIQLLIPPVNLRAPVFVLLYGAAELFLGVTGTLPGIAHFAHLGGMLCGGVLLLWWLRPRRSRP